MKQHKKKQFLLILTEIVLLLFLAAVSTYAAETDWTRYFPLKKGNTWVYETEGYNDGKVDITIKVTGVQKVCGKNCHVYESYARNKLRMKEYYRITREGLIAHRRVFKGGAKTVDFIPEQYMLKFPLTQGKTWEWTGKVNPKKQSNVGYKVMGSEMLTVPAGTFKAIKVRMEGVRPNDVRFVSFRWYAEGVGMVKEESTVTTGTKVMNITAVLKSYTLIGK